MGNLGKFCERTGNKLKMGKDTEEIKGSYVRQASVGSRNNKLIQKLESTETGKSEKINSQLFL